MPFVECPKCLFQWDPGDQPSDEFSCPRCFQPLTNPITRSEKLDTPTRPSTDPRVDLDLAAGKIGMACCAIVVVVGIGFAIFVSTPSPAVSVTLILLTVIVVLMFALRALGPSSFEDPVQPRIIPRSDIGEPRILDYSPRSDDSALSWFVSAMLGVIGGILAGLVLLGVGSPIMLAVIPVFGLGCLLYRTMRGLGIGLLLSLPVAFLLLFSMCGGFRL